LTKLLMKIIREKRNLGCYSPPLKNLVPRIRKEGKHKNTMKDALVMEIREYQNSREEDLRGLPCRFSFRAWVTEPVAESGHVAFIT
jgi:hypothetical protein